MVFEWSFWNVLQNNEVAHTRLAKCALYLPRLHLSKGLCWKGQTGTNNQSKDTAIVNRGSECSESWSLKYHHLLAVVKTPERGYRVRIHAQCLRNIRLCRNACRWMVGVFPYPLVQSVVCLRWYLHLRNLHPYSLVVHSPNHYLQEYQEPFYPLGPHQNALQLFLLRFSCSHLRTKHEKKWVAPRFDCSCLRAQKSEKINRRWCDVSCAITNNL